MYVEPLAGEELYCLVRLLEGVVLREYVEDSLGSAYRNTARFVLDIELKQADATAGCGSDFA